MNPSRNLLIESLNMSLDSVEMDLDDVNANPSINHQIKIATSVDTVHIYPENISLPQKKNRYCTSYGLIVKTQYPPDSVLMVERKLPYCVVNRLLRKAKKDILNVNLVKMNHLALSKAEETTTTTKTSRNLLNRNAYKDTDNNNNKNNNNDFGLSRQYRWISCKLKKSIENLDSRDFRDNPQDFTDFVRYKFKLPFEDQYDFPHGQMQKRIKRHVSFTAGDGGSISEKYAGFLTAFLEFEEETGYTFRFDFKMIQKQCREMVIQFTGLDGYEYQQHFYIVRVDKLYKLHRPSSNFQFSMGNRNEQYFHREIDKHTYIPRLIKLEDAKNILIRQQKEIQKIDYKHTLLNESFYEDKINTCNEYAKWLPYNSFEEDDDKNNNNQEEKMNGDPSLQTETEQEKNFINFIRRVEPDIYKRCLRKSKWRDRSD